MSARMTRKRARTESEHVFKQEHGAAGAQASTISTTARSADADSLANPPRHNQGDVVHDKPRAPQHDPEFWFSDGTVILVAQAVEFRVYRGLLAEYSPVFRAMFGAAAPKHPPQMAPVDEPQVIACPVVEFFEEMKPSFHQISAYIRLGQKYKLDELYEQSRQFLKHHYTDDLGTWDTHTAWQPAGWQGSHSIGVVNLARPIDEPSLLLIALMACVYMDAAIVHGLEREDGTRETLTPDDLGRCFKASKDVREAHVTVIMHTFQDTASPACGPVKICGRVLRGTLRKLEARMDWLMSSSPFLKFDELLRDIPVELGTCAACTMMVKRRHRKEREAFWARLPQLLDIEVPGWAGDIPQGETAARA
ncbi:hypothetical protein GSI_12023 [Ganoderma sinense ZZ0214-1]|uniref:BTB domain-containing protein n=1 Tax=Ganoderma sinense ZZ0214-1 TaxID=1077348 RepID=A0A2G8RXQ4_9APHY|nr:hypothetical protein GSI_12023 [Ganoderma sinense ZZ0214-1]